MFNYKYKIYIPGGNDTALVFGIVNDPETRKKINDEIMSRHSNVEQVGFLSLDNSHPELMMAGGEFCGNATRAAAWYYLNGTPGSIEIIVSGVSAPLKAGVDNDLNAWAEMPVDTDLTKIKTLADGYNLVELEGITHLVISSDKSKSYLSSSEDLKEQALALLKRYELTSYPAAGVIFTSEIDGGYAIHPCVYVSAINTMFYETACGSGTVAAGLVFAALQNKSVNIPFVQPSSGVINAIIDVASDHIVIRAMISGSITCDDVIYKR